ncbi:MAG: isoleucine--tRNA ligase [Bacteroidetes bacterium]|nr:isoleucine--tRNA ligase [Rhodothermia bacterium]MCS7155055.1 isoleucine--tRNA ligase [Bacteroidota bacterium]MCX7907339.1 isoleucine--tRNA ligase [Bacteroidota bacterium]MDW8137934.1 isoleucine--tRNA ligase [Bacteroidota bacterium]MDW8286214.1 isoleucine--tRNA ligase [Bacteroidota bacterium]
MQRRFPEFKSLHYPTLEAEILAWWEANSIFEKSLTAREGGLEFTFYEGPPTANGRPGIHHVMARTIKDLFCRYRTQKGYRVLRKAGWDTHGLPVEIEVEKELGIQGREQIERFGIAAFNAHCRQSVLRYKELWDELTRRMGYWVDLEHPYITFDNRYIETLWWILQQCYNRGLLYRGYKIQPYCPKCGTALSSHEVGLGYEEVEDPSVYVRFPLRDAPNTHLLAWTTTPWTLTANVALAVGPDLVYVRAQQRGAQGPKEELILAEARLDLLGDAYEVVERLEGRQLVGRAYEPPFSYLKPDRPCWRVVAADFVSYEEGTGIVHIAPAFGAEDFEVGRAEDLPFFNPIRPDGTFEACVAEVAGQWFKDADRTIVRLLRERGRLFRAETHRHSYPHCWRHGTPLLYYPVESWFLRTTAFKERMVELNRSIRWRPEGVGSGRFGQWLEHNVDWSLSRRRFWGTPLPIWICDRCGAETCVGSIEELRRRGRLSPEAELDLHRPYVDAISWPCERCQEGTMRRVPDLVDVWFDSGAMPYAQWHYPFENRDRFKAHFPADFIAEGVDQTRGWFYTLHALAVMLFDSVAFRNVVVNGLVLDERGEKMSKSRGNTVDPFEVLATYGADATRWYLIANSPPWENLRFSVKGIQEVQRRFFSTLLHTYNFFALYANVDGFCYQGERLPPASRSEMDRWILSRLNSTIKAVDGYLEDYDPTRAARAIEAFVDELSNWYVRRNRRRFWKSDMGLDKVAAYQTLYECLLNTAKLMAPIAPFFAEWLYQNLNGVTGREPYESVHLAFFPVVEETAIDAVLEYRMELARRVVSLVLSLRNRAGINVRQPLRRILIPRLHPEARAAIEEMREIILDEVNVKTLEYVEDDSGLVQKSVKPNFRLLGPRLGARMRAVAEAARTLAPDQIATYEATGHLELTVDGQRVVLQPGELEVIRQDIAGWLVESEGELTVALDTTITPELRAEGLAREFVNRVQQMRKEAEYAVTDRIAIFFEADPELAAALEAQAAYVQRETLAEVLQAGLEPGDLVRDWDIEGNGCRIAVRRLLTT